MVHSCLDFVTYDRAMLIQSTTRDFSAARPGAAPALEKGQVGHDAPADISTEDAVTLTASTAVGGLAVGLGGAYLGLSLGVEYGMNAGVNAFGGHPVGQALGAALLGIPLALAYGVMGATAGSVAGTLVGGAAGFGVGHLINKHSHS